MARAHEGGGEGGGESGDEVGVEAGGESGGKGGDEGGEGGAAAVRSGGSGALKGGVLLRPARPRPAFPPTFKAPPLWDHRH